MSKQRKYLLASLAVAMAMLPFAPGSTVRAARVAAADKSAPDRPESGGAVSWEDARLLAEILQRVRENYVQPVDDKTLMRRAATGMVTGLDEYSTLLDRDAYEDLKVATSGTYAGIGIEIESTQSRLTVVRVIPASPAESAGVLVGDTIEAIDGVPVTSGNLDTATAAMRGESGTSVGLRIARDGHTRQLSMLRSRVELPSVESEVLQPGIAYVRISSFTDETAAEFAAALHKIQQQQGKLPGGLVIDLRNNPGGVLDAAVNVADDLLEAGVIVSAEGRTEDARFTDRATPGDLSGGAAIAVLVNGGSASAAEILAAALHDNSRATLIGRKTYGKGSVQTIMPLSGGQALKLTTSRYYTPAGISLDHRGIVPDVRIDGAELPQADLDAPGAPATLARRDPEVGVALQRLREKLRVAVGERVPDIRR